MFADLIISPTMKVKTYQDYKRLNYLEKQEVDDLEWNRMRNDNFYVKINSLPAALVLIGSRKTEEKKMTKDKTMMNDSINAMKDKSSLVDIVSRRGVRAYPVLLSALSKSKKELAIKKIEEIIENGNTAIPEVCDTKVHNITALTALLVLTHTEEELEELRDRYSVVISEYENVKKKVQKKKRIGLDPNLFIELREALDLEDYEKISSDRDLTCLRFVRDYLAKDEYEKLYKYVLEPAEEEAPSWISVRVTRTCKINDIISSMLKNYTYV